MALRNAVMRLGVMVRQFARTQIYLVGENCNTLVSINMICYICVHEVRGILVILHVRLSGERLESLRATIEQ